MLALFFFTEKCSTGAEWERFSALPDGHRDVMRGSDPEEARSRRDDDLLQEAEDEAAAEAAGIGGRSGMEGMDEAERAAAEHGGGESEGFEEAEALLEEQATHGEPPVDPLEMAFPEEAELSETSYGEADSIESAEKLDD